MSTPVVLQQKPTGVDVLINVLDPRKGLAHVVLREHLPYHTLERDIAVQIRVPYTFDRLQLDLQEALEELRSDANILDLELAFLDFASKTGVIGVQFP